MWFRNPPETVRKTEQGGEGVSYGRLYITRAVLINRHLGTSAIATPDLFSGLEPPYELRSRKQFPDAMNESTDGKRLNQILHIVSGKKGLNLGITGETGHKDETIREGWP